MRHFTPKEKRAGEMAVRSLSEKAQAGYNNTDPLKVWEYQTEAGPRYAFAFAGDRQENLTAPELEEMLEGLTMEFEAAALLSGVDIRAPETSGKG